MALPKTTGISLKPEHYQEILTTRPNIGWLEVHPENYMGAGGLPHRFLSAIHQHYPLSMHSVGLSLGSSEGVEPTHLNAIAQIVARHNPQQISEHLAWSHWNGIFLNDLLPIPYTKEFLAIVENNIHQVQDALKRKILIENPSVYIGFKDNDYSETDFLDELVKRTGCGLLLDISNVFVSSNNQSYSAEKYIDNYPYKHIGEIHLAGYKQNKIDNNILLIDDHGSIVSNEVWQLFTYTLKKVGQPTPILLEWDTDIPELALLVDEADKAQQIMDTVFCRKQINEC